MPKDGYVWGRMDASDTGEGKHAGERTQKIHTTHTCTHDIPRFGALVWR